MAIRNDFTVDWDASPRVITVAAPSVELVAQDLHDTCRFLEATGPSMDDKPLVDSSGYEDLGGGTKVGLTVTLQNALVAFEARSGPVYIQCNVGGGNLVAVDEFGASLTTPIFPTAFTQVVVTASSSATSSNTAAIEYSSFDGHITVDLLNGTSGVDYPTGTPRQPSGNLADAMLIATSRGFTELFFVGDALIDNGDDYTGMTFIGESMTKSVLTVSVAATVTKAEFYEAHIAGTLDGDALLNHCILDNLNYVSGKVENCVLEEGVIQLGGNVQADFLNCWSGEAGSGSPCIDCGGVGQNLTVRNYSGGLLLTNKTGVNDKVSVDLISGQVKVDLTTVTAGELIVRGTGKVIDYATGEWLPSGVYDSLTLINETVFGEMLQEVHRMLELDKLNPVTAGPDGITSGDIDIVFTDNGDGTKTATRQ